MTAASSFHPVTLSVQSGMALGWPGALTQRGAARRCLTQMGTAKESFVELTERIGRKTGFLATRDTVCALGHGLGWPGALTQPGARRRCLTQMGTARESFVELTKRIGRKTGVLAARDIVCAVWHGLGSLGALTRRARGCRCLTQMGTAKESFVELTERIGRKTGGLAASPLVADVRGEREPAAYLMVAGKAMAGKAGDLFELFRDILLTARLDDRERFKQARRGAALGNDTVCRMRHDRLKGSAAAVSCSAFADDCECVQQALHVSNMRQASLSAAPCCVQPSATCGQAFAAGVWPCRCIHCCGRPGQLSCAVLVPVQGAQRGAEGNCFLCRLFRFRIQGWCEPKPNLSIDFNSNYAQMVLETKAGLEAGVVGAGHRFAA